MDFSGIAAAAPIGLACRLNAPKYKPAITSTDAAAMPAKIVALLPEVLPRDIVTLVSRVGSCSCWATSAADCGRFDWSFAKHAAIVFSQIGGTEAGSISNSLRRSVIEGATRSQICRSMLPE